MTDTTLPEKYERLREAARKANGGKWYCEVDGWPVWEPEPGKGFLPYWAAGIDESENNPYKPYEVSFPTLGYVADANPTAILELLDDLQALREALREIAGLYEGQKAADIALYALAQLQEVP